MAKKKTIETVLCDNAVTRVRKMDPLSPIWGRKANVVAREFVDVVACGHCGYPRISTCICDRCGYE